LGIRIGPDGGTGAPRCSGDQTPIKAIVVGLEKHGLAPIAALGDMMGASPAQQRARSGPCLPLPSADLRDVHSGVAQSCKLSPEP
jgi:hypothetical protein